MKNNKLNNFKLPVLISSLIMLSSNIDAITIKSLNRSWYFNKGYESQTQWKETVDLPHTWNAADAMFGNTNYYRGMANYSKFITIPADNDHKRFFLKINAAQTVADIYIDNHFIAQHKGGYTAFTIEITDFVTKGKKHKLDIRVNNSQTMEIAPICGDFNIWGGLNRGVELLMSKDEICIDPTFYGSSGIFSHKKMLQKKVQNWK